MSIIISLLYLVSLKSLDGKPSSFPDAYSEASFPGICRAAPIVGSEIPGIVFLEILIIMVYEVIPIYLCSIYMYIP